MELYVIISMTKMKEEKREKLAKLRGRAFPLSI